MKEHNRLRIGRLTERYARRQAEARAPEQAAFLAEFEALRREVLAPLMEELAGELKKAGHSPRIAINEGGKEGELREDSEGGEGDEGDEGEERPRVELFLGLRGGTGKRNCVGFKVIRWTDQPLQILAYLEVNPPPFDLMRFARAADVTPDRAEQILVDAIEHIIACNTP